MSAKVLTKAAAKEAKIDIIEDGRGTQAVHDVVVAMRAARRSGSANTKTKAEVDLSGAKPWRQKGTGRARAGYKSSPIWRGGGVVFGPKPRDYSKKISKSVRRLAFRKALSERISRITKTKPSAQWVKLLNDAGVPCGPINSIDQTFAEPQVQHLGIAKPVRHPELGDIRVVGQPITLTAAPQPGEYRPTPELGQHTEEIMAGIGRDAKTIADLRARGVI